MDETETRDWYEFAREKIDSREEELLDDSDLSIAAALEEASRDDQPAPNYSTLKANARERVLQRMSDMDWHSYTELSHPSVGGLGYNSRLLQLRHMGYQVESREQAGKGSGKEYRLRSMSRGTPQVKRVKIYLSEYDAEKLDRGEITPDTYFAVCDSLRSFRAAQRRA